MSETEGYYRTTGAPVLHFRDGMGFLTMMGLVSLGGGT